MKWIELLKAWMGKAAGERLAVSETDGAPLIAAGFARWVEDDPLTPVIARGVEAALGGFTRGLDGIITETLKKFAQAQGLSRRNGSPIIHGPAGPAGDEKKTFGDWLVGVARNDRGYLEKHYGSTFQAWGQQAALGESSGAAGGYTVPPDFHVASMSAVAENANFRNQGAYVHPMGPATRTETEPAFTMMEASGRPVTSTALLRQSALEPPAVG